MNRNDKKTSIIYREPMINYYVDDVEGLASFYCENFGFRETFRAQQDGITVHVEMRLGDLILGFASIEAAKAMHNLPLNPGLPRSEVALWTDDVDEAHAALTAKGIPCISQPHDFLETPPLRSLVHRSGRESNSSRLSAKILSQWDSSLSILTSVTK